MEEIKDKEKKAVDPVSFKIKKDCKVNVGEIYELKKGENLPKKLVSLGKGYIESFKTDGII